MANIKVCNYIMLGKNRKAIIDIENRIYYYGSSQMSIFAEEGEERNIIDSGELPLTEEGWNQIVEGWQEIEMEKASQEIWTSAKDTANWMQDMLQKYASPPVPAP